MFFTFEQGKIRINSHFFEDGNVCLKEVKKVEVDKVKLTGEDIEKEAKLIVKHIIEQEQAVLAGLEDIYNSMSDNIFKNMRRLLPGKFKKNKMIYYFVINSK